jgi:hypothetical protein
MTWDDDTSVEIVFTSKAERKSSVAVTHQKLSDKSSLAKMKSGWDERFNALFELLS